MTDERLKNPCADCKRKRICEQNSNYFRVCLRYRAWICWNWEKFRAGFYALKAREGDAGVRSWIVLLSGK